MAPTPHSPTRERKPLKCPHCLELKSICASLKIVNDVYISTDYRYNVFKQPMNFSWTIFRGFNFCRYAQQSMILRGHSTTTWTKFYPVFTTQSRSITIGFTSQDLLSFHTRMYYPFFSFCLKWFWTRLKLFWTGPKM